MRFGAHTKVFVLGTVVGKTSLGAGNLFAKYCGDLSAPMKENPVPEFRSTKAPQLVHVEHNKLAAVAQAVEIDESTRSGHAQAQATRSMTRNSSGRVR